MRNEENKTNELGKKKVKTKQRGNWEKERDEGKNIERNDDTIKKEKMSKDGRE